MKNRPARGVHLRQMHNDRPYHGPDFWEQRLVSDFSLAGSGVKTLGSLPNRILYQKRLEVLELILREIGIQSLERQRILDIGCGTGFYTAFLHSAGVRYYVGLDITTVSVQMLSRCYPEYRFVSLDIGGEVPDEWLNAFDIAIAADVLFHLVDDRGWHRAIANMAKCLRPSGLLLATEVWGDNTLQPVPHVRLRSVDAYRAALQSAGLELVRTEPILPFSRIGAFLLRLPGVDRRSFSKIVSLAALFASRWFVAMKI
jgi:SAM-dependent methyltransferase